MREGRLAVLAAIALAGVFAGCAPSTGSKAGDAGGEQGSGSGTVKMVLWPGPEGDAMGKVVEAYNAGQGAKDKIKVEMTRCRVRTPSPRRRP